MKKILILMLVFVMALSVVACSPAADPTADFAAIKAAAEASTSYSTITVTTKVTTDIAGALESSIETAFAEDGSKTITYTYDVLDASDAFAVPEKKTEVITCNAAGTYSDGGAFVSENQLALGFKLALNADNIAEYSVSANALSAKVAADKTESVLGVNFGADVDVVVTVAAEKLAYISVVYTDANGYAVEITCTYA